MKIGDRVKHITGVVGKINRIIPIDDFTEMCQVFTDNNGIYYAPIQEWERV